MWYVFNYSLFGGWQFSSCSSILLLQIAFVHVYLCYGAKIKDRSCLDTVGMERCGKLGSSTIRLRVFESGTRHQRNWISLRCPFRGKISEVNAILPCFAPGPDTGEISDTLFTELWELGKFRKNSKHFALMLSTNLQFAENRHNLHRHSQILNMWPHWVPTSEATAREKEISLHANGHRVCMCWCKRCRRSDSYWSFGLQAFEEASKILTEKSPVAGG